MVDVGITQTALGARLDPPAVQSCVSHYLRGEYSPGLPRANEFALLTKGNVPTSSWSQVASSKELRVLASCLAKLRRLGHEEGWRERRRRARKARAA